MRIVAEANRALDGTPIGVHGFFQDVSAQRGVEQALLESERAARRTPRGHAPRARAGVS
ncbi:hypothetical protein GCM10010343_12640 [Streptomyces avidinii]|nr:hypothetical protein GCM10010343_12640 [Streptomyces avidinii]